MFFDTQPKLLASTAFNKTCGRDGSGTFTTGCYYKDSKDDEYIEIYDVGSSTQLTRMVFLIILGNIEKP